MTNPIILEKLMKYFTGSTWFNFREEMNSMFFFNGFEGDCASKENAEAFESCEYDYNALPEDIKTQRYRFTTDFALKCRNRLEKARDCFDISLSNEQIEYYFTADYIEDQLFAILFGRWLKLPMKQIHRLERKRNSNRLHSLLKYFICLSEGQDDVTEDKCEYKGVYYVIVDYADRPSEYLKAKYIDKGQIQIESTGEILYISPRF